MRTLCQLARLLIAGVVVWCAAGRSGVADELAMAGFPAPKARCMHALNGRILTTVRRFAIKGLGNLEAVADTEPKADYILLENPSITVFDEKCGIIWRQTYQYLAEVGVVPVMLPGGVTMLHVSATSYLQPADQMIKVDQLLGYDGFSLAQMLSFGQDRYDYSYFGPLGCGVALVEVRLTDPLNPVRPDVSAKLRRWEAIPSGDPNIPPFRRFGDPQKLDETALNALHLPQMLPHVPYPAIKFLSGLDDP